MPLTNTGLHHTIAEFMMGQTVELWMNAVIETDGTVTLVSGALDVDDHPDAVNIGYTQDGIELLRTPAFTEVPVDQAIDPIDAAYSSQDVHMKTSMLQIRNYETIAALNPGTQLFTGTGTKGISDGFNKAFTLYNLVAIAPSHNDVSKMQVMIIYAGYNMAAFSAKFAKQYHKTPLDFKAQDAGRTDGKTWMVYETTS